jgi:hypothetical protein
MKNKFCPTFFFLIVSLSVPGQEPGMNVEEFRKKYPGIVPEKTEFHEDIYYKEKLGEFNGAWYYNFSQDTLDDVFYSDNMGPAPQQKCVRSFVNLRNFFSQQLGKPSTEIFSDTLLGKDRVRKKNKDTLALIVWTMPTCKFEMGLYFTGNAKLKPDASDLVSQTNAPAPVNYYLFAINIIPEENPGAAGEWKIYPGVSVFEIQKTKPQLFPDGIGINGQWGKAEKRYGLAGDWNYTFKNSKLDWWIWDYYSDKLNENNFITCLKATRQLIAEYTKKYGAPDYTGGELRYKDPAKEFHSGYEVLKAEWKKDNFNLVVEFQFMGGKSSYQFLVKSEMQKN